MKILCLPKSAQRVKTICKHYWFLLVNEDGLAIFAHFTHKGMYYTTEMNSTCDQYRIHADCTYDYLIS